MREPQRRLGVAEPVQKLNPHFVALGVLGVLLAAALIFLFTRGGDSGQDRLTNDQAGATVNGDDPEARCADPANNDRIKRELFRRAAAVRGRDEAAYNRLAGFAVLRAETPILRGYDQRVDGVSCSAYISVDLPPGVSANGRRTLTGEVGYSIHNGLQLTDADAIVAPLATLVRDGQPPEAELGAEQPALPVEENVTASEPAEIQAGPATVYPGRPSFDCDDAETRGEVAVCENPGLAALDVNMAAEFRRAITNASPSQRAALTQTRDRFLAYRDNCPTIGCMREAYMGRMREIRDIVESR